MAAGISQKLLADTLNISESIYQYYEYGKKEPTMGKLEKFAQYYNVSIDYLCGLDDIPNRRQSDEESAALEQAI
jgi:transcriptional regulator with XRE-family HTH domain